MALPTAAWICSLDILEFMPSCGYGGRCDPCEDWVFIIEDAGAVVPDSIFLTFGCCFNSSDIIF